MPGQHAKLSPSASERWLVCPASIRMEEKVPPEPESSYAHEGTVAHALGEMKAALRFGFIDKAEYFKQRSALILENELSAETVAEMDEHTDSYVVLLEERLALYPNSRIMLEQRLNTGVPRCWGTSDAVIFSPYHVEIVDFKYGSGILVSAWGNPQLRLYACGAMDEFADILGDTELIRSTVYQPRMDNVDTEEITPEELRAWRAEEVIPVAEIAFTDDAPFGPSDDACRWCPASGRCKAQLEWVFSTDFEEDPETLSPELVSETLAKVKMIRDWLNAFEQAALTMAYSEETEIPGYKVVQSGGQRSVTDQVGAINALLEAGYLKDQVVNTKAKGIGDLEKLLGKEQFKELLEDAGFVRKSEGKPSLVPDSDRRSSIAPNTQAAKEFAQESELL